jgi:hypothetical protein
VRRSLVSVLAFSVAVVLTMGADVSGTGTVDLEDGAIAPAAGASDNVEWIDNIAIHTGTAGGKLLGGLYYVTDPRGLYIYDVSDPTSPEMVGSMLAQQLSTHVVFAQEEPDTNGDILLVDAVHPDAIPTSIPLHPTTPMTTNGWMLVVDVSDPTDPHVIGSLDIYDHTWTCVLDCSYAIGRTGHIVDLTDPTDPRVVADWREHVEGDGYMHDFTEVASGRVIGSGQPSFYLDLTDPLNPVELARIDSDFHSLGYHGSTWPNDATDPLMLLGAEVAPEGATNLAGSDCNDESTYAVATYDATDVIAVDEKQFNERNRQGSTSGDKRGFTQQRQDANFVKLHEWRVDGRGVYVDGYAPAHTLYCGHWFQAHPDWDSGGVLAIAHYDWGARFLDVSSEGRMDEIGWWQPIAGYTGAAYWITDEIVYVHDYRRGMDILRFAWEEDEG